jgi:hypothetical protein
MQHAPMTAAYTVLPYKKLQPLQHTMHLPEPRINNTNQTIQLNKVHTAAAVQPNTQHQQATPAASGSAAHSSTCEPVGK